MHRPTHRATAAFATAAAALLITSACDQSPVDRGAVNDSSALVFSGIPNGTSITLQQDFQPLLEMLRKETGREIRVQDTTDYDALIEGIRAGTIDIAAFGPLSYVLAKQRGAQITVVAAQVKEKSATPGFQSYAITWAGSPIETLADFRGKKICFVDRKSTSGYLYPSAGLLAVGVRPLQDTEPIFAGDHEASVLAVANKQCDGGFAYDAMVDRHLIERGQIKSGQIVTVWKSETIPGAPLAIANDLAPELRQQLTTAIQQKANADYLRANGFCQGECPLGDADAYGFKPVDDAFYDSVREVCKLTQHESCTEG